MLRYLWIAPLVLLAGCSKTEVATSRGPVGYAQPAGTSAATTTPPAAAAADPTEPVAPPAAQDTADTVETVGTRRAIPSGTSLHVRINEAIDTSRNRAGDGFSASLTEPVREGGRVMIPAGTEFRGHVTNASASGRMKGRAQLGLTLDSFRLNGREYRVKTTSVDRVSASHKKRNGILIGGGAGLGAALGAIAGGGKGALIGAGAGAGAGTAGAALTGKKEVGIGAETPVRFTLRSAIEL
jgi:hypothetical protein